MNDLNLAFYTYFFGTNDNPAFAIPIIPSLKYKCYYYTNNKNIIEKLKNTNWISIYIEKEFNDDIYEPNMFGKHLKTMPHKYEEIKDYDYLCFLDSKLAKLDEDYIEDVIKNNFINDNKALIIRNHNGDVNNNIWSELCLSTYQPRYFNERYKYIKYIRKYISLGCLEKTENHCITGFLIRNMKHKKIIELNSTWYKHIQECGIQCQISFFFIKQMFNDCILPISKNPFKDTELNP